MVRGTCSSSTDETYERIAAMRMVEGSGAYQCCNYFEYADSATRTSASDAIDAGSRAKLIDWMHSIADFCGHDRDTVSVAASLADRFFSRRTADARAALGDPYRFQLVFLTSLHVAVKMREQVHLDGPVLSRLSRGRYAAEEFDECERQLLCVLNWRVNCPTAMEFVHEFACLLPKDIARTTGEENLVEHARRMTQVAVGDSRFITAKPSNVALAVISESVRHMSHREFPLRKRDEYLSVLGKACGTSISSGTISLVRLWLQYRSIAGDGATHLVVHCDDAMDASQDEQADEQLKDSPAERQKERSPVCISRLSMSRSSTTGSR